MPAICTIWFFIFATILDLKVVNVVRDYSSNLCVQVRDNVKPCRSVKPPVALERDVQPIKNALAGKYDAPIRLDPVECCKRGLTCSQTMDLCFVLKYNTILTYSQI
jgi:hypothetical protein